MASNNFAETLFNAAGQDKSSQVAQGLGGKAPHAAHKLELQGNRNSITAQFNAVKVGHQLEQVPRGNIFQEVQNIYTTHILTKTS